MSSPDEYFASSPEEWNQRNVEKLPASVWVVAADMMDGGHPQVLGVYDNEDAARAHEQAIRDNGGCIRRNGYDHPVASFWTYEKPIESDYGGIDERE